jgi:hypothetical protein
MRTKTVISIAALGTTIAVLSACGGGGGDAAPEATAPTTTQPPNTGGGTPSTGTPSTGTPSTGTPSTGTPTTPPASTTASVAYVVQAATNASSTAAGTAYTGGSILKCTINASGDLTACSSTGMPAVNNPLALAFSGTSAFILNQTAPKSATGTGIQYSVQRCAVGTDGVLSSCTDTSPGVSTETDFASKLIATANSGYALKEGQLLKCPPNFAGACGVDPSSVAFPAGIVASDMIAANNRIFVVNAGAGTTPGSVLSWGVDATTGALSATSITATDASFATALRIDETTLDSPASIAFKAPYAYVLTRYANKVIQCSFNSTTNTMTACAETTPLSTLTGITPRNIAVQGNFAYITDSAAAAAGNSIVKCSIGATDGRLGSCAAVPNLTFTSGIVDVVLR